MQLNKIEAKVYEAIKEKKKINLEDLLLFLKEINEDTIRRSLEILKREGLIDENTIISKKYSLDKNGLVALENGFIEENFCNYIKDKKIKISDLSTLEIPKLKKEEISLAFGLAKKKNYVTIVDGFIFVSEGFSAEVEKEKQILESIKSNKSVSKQEVDSLLKRKDFIKEEDVSYKSYKLLQIVYYETISDKELYLTSEHLKTGDYKKIDYKEFDVSVLPRPKDIGRIHPLKIIINQLRDLYLEMGFKEMKGPYVETSFWNMDAMFISQDHPARDSQDTFFLKESGSLPLDELLIENVSTIHKNGGSTGSFGYQYDWSEAQARSLVLRTHTTAVTFRTLYDLSTEEKQFSKYFSIGKVFRNETIDSTHLPEFHQAEGFVIGPNLGLADLLGFIKEFFSKLGINEIRFKPTYNPYTEPSVEAYCYLEKENRWVEIINAGIFRPEATTPFGISNNVIAWGLGVERLAMLLYKCNSLKEIHGDEPNLDWLRTYILPKRHL
jgi:phenylalanyl-tRNA synthetase alpha chain